MKAYRFFLALSLAVAMVLGLSVTAQAAWWSDNHNECPCFTASLIDAYLVQGVVLNPAEVEVLGGINDISGEAFIGFQPSRTFFRAYTHYTFGPESEGYCSVEGEGLSMLLTDAPAQEYRVSVNQIQHNACLQEIKGSSASRFRTNVPEP